MPLDFVRFAQFAHDPLCKRGRLFRPLHRRLQHNEFIAAKAGDAIGLANDSAQPVRHGA
jgi:hypothetical protein